MPFRKMQWYFPYALTLHNAEEAVFMPRWIAVHGSPLPFHGSVVKIWLGLLLISVGAFVLTRFSDKKGRQSVPAYLLFGCIAALLANVFIPHIPATLLFHTYTPGIVTAVLINLPLCVALLRRAVRDGWATGNKAIASAVLVPVVLAGALVAYFGF